MKDSKRLKKKKPPKTNCDDSATQQNMELKKPKTKQHTRNFMKLLKAGQTIHGRKTVLQQQSVQDLRVSKGLP